MGLYSNNDWRYYQSEYLSHAWGTSPEMKSKEKEYNAKYYQEHKDEILKNARERNASQADFDREDDHEFRGRSVTDSDSLKKRTDEEMSELDRLIAENEKNGNYPPDVMENIKKHNEMVKENIEKLTKTVDDYITSHPNMSKAELENITKSLTTQLDRAHTQMIDLSSSSGKSYVDELMKKRGGSSTVTQKTSSTPKKTDMQIRNQQIQAENAAKLSTNSGSNPREKGESLLDEQLRKYGKK